MEATMTAKEKKNEVNNADNTDNNVSNEKSENNMTNNAINECKSSEETSVIAVRADPEATTEETTAAPEATTATPEATTAAPEATTATPEATTAAPEATTAAPEATTAAPEATTAAPEATTVNPETTTAAPEATTASPEATTAAPEATTETPEATTAAPEATTAAPEATNAAPEATTAAPEATTAAPKATTAAPEATTVDPETTTAAPEATTAAPETTTVDPNKTTPESSNNREDQSELPETMKETEQKEEVEKKKETTNVEIMTKKDENPENVFEEAKESSAEEKKDNGNSQPSKETSEEIKEEKKTEGKKREEKLERKDDNKPLDKKVNFLRQFRSSTSSGGFRKFTASQFMEVWNHFDTDGSGYIEDHELDGFLKEFVLSSCREGESRQEILSDSAMALFKETFMDAFDENQDGMIDISELAEILPTDENFLLLFHLKNPLNSSVEFMRIWRKFDKECKGYIDSSELTPFLKHILDNQKTVVSDDKLNEYTETILNLFDLNRDGKLQLAEMSRLMPVKQNLLSKPFLKGAICITRRDIDRLFKIYDENNNGTIEDEELSGLLKDLMDLGEKECTLGDIEKMKNALMEHWDVDNDGSISKSELRMFLIQQCKMAAENQGIKYEEESDDDFD